MYYIHGDISVTVLIRTFILHTKSMNAALLRVKSSSSKFSTCDIKDDNNTWLLYITNITFPCICKYMYYKAWS